MRISAVFILIFCSGIVAAQSNLTLYHFNGLAQSLQTNPAMPQQTKVWIGLPGLGGTDVYYHNSGFAAADLFLANTDINSNLETVINGLDANSQLASHTGVNLLGVGFKAGKSFWSFRARQVVDYRMDLDRSLFRLLYYGNTEEDTRNISLEGFDLEVSNRSEYSLGYQAAFNEEKLRIGANFKYLVGQQHAYVDKMDIRVETTDSSTLRTQADALIRTSGFNHHIEGEEDLDLKSELFAGNRGFAVDLGFWFKPGDHWSFSASVLDLGSIKWEQNTMDYRSEGNFNFDGISADLAEEEPISEESIADSLEAAFDFQEIPGNSYTRALNPQLYLGAEYWFNEKHSLGALYHTRIWEGQFYNDFSLSYNARFARFFQLSTSYSLINGTYHNVGLGFSLKAGPVQLFVISDNLLQAYYYEDLQSTNLNVGLNIAFYGKKNKVEDPEPRQPEIPEAPEEQREEQKKSTQNQPQI